MIRADALLLKSCRACHALRGCVADAFLGVSARSPRPTILSDDGSVAGTTPSSSLDTPAHALKMATLALVIPKRKDYISLKGSEGGSGTLDKCSGLTAFRKCGQVCSSGSSVRSHSGVSLCCCSFCPVTLLQILSFNNEFSIAITNQAAVLHSNDNACHQSEVN